MLILADEFNGWDNGQSWENLSFQTRNDPLIRKMALVAAQRWESLALLFTAKGHRPFPIECFTSQIAARAWLCDGADTQTCFRFILPLHETPHVPRLLPVIRAVCQRILRNTRSPCQRGFDVSSEEYWQVVAGLACRTIAIDYRQQGFVYDTQTSGPNIGLVVTF